MEMSVQDTLERKLDEICSSHEIPSSSTSTSGYVANTGLADDQQIKKETEINFAVGVPPPQRPDANAFRFEMPSSSNNLEEYLPYLNDQSVADYKIHQSSGSIPSYSLPYMNAPTSQNPPFKFEYDYEHDEDYNELAGGINMNTSVLRDVKQEEGEMKPETSCEKISMTNSQIKHVLKKFACSTNKRLIFAKEQISRDSDENLLTSQKGSPLIYFESCLYRPYYEDAVGDVVARCDTKGSCRGKIKCNRLTGAVVILSLCNHLPKTDEIKLKLGQRKARIDKLRGVSTCDIVKNLANYAEKNSISGYLGNSRSISQFVRRGIALAPEPTFPPLINFEGWKEKGIEVVYDDRFSFSDTGMCSVIWTHARCREYFANSKVLHVDRKYSGIAPGFQQFVVLSTEIGPERKAFPLLFCLTTKRDTDHYKLIYTEAQKLGIQPNVVFTDFEPASVEAAPIVWPGIRTRLCFRHFKVAIRKQLMEAVDHYETFSKYRSFLQNVYSLAFVEPNLLISHFRYVSEKAKALDKRISKVLLYLNNTFVGDGVEPVFPHSFWECRERLSRNEDYTNRISECLFSLFKSKCRSIPYVDVESTIGITHDWIESTRQQMILDEAVTAQPSPSSAKFKSFLLSKKALKEYATPEDFLAVVPMYIPVPKLFK